MQPYWRNYIDGRWCDGAGGRLTVDLGEEQSVPVSRRHTPAVKAALVESRRLERDT